MGLVSVDQEPHADGYLHGQVWSRPVEEAQGSFELVESPYLESSRQINYYGRIAINDLGTPCYPLAAYYDRVADGSIPVSNPSVDLNPQPPYAFPARIWIEIQSPQIRSRLLNLWRSHPPSVVAEQKEAQYYGGDNRRSFTDQVTDLSGFVIFPVDGFDMVAGEPWDGGDTIGCSWQATATITGSYKYSYWVMQGVAAASTYNPRAYRYRERALTLTQGQPFTLDLPSLAVPDTLNLPLPLAQQVFSPRELRTNRFEISKTINSAGVRITTHLFTPQDLTYQALGFSQRAESEPAWADPEGPSANTYPLPYGNYGPSGICQGQNPGGPPGYRYQQSEITTAPLNWRRIRARCKLGKTTGTPINQPWPPPP